MSDTLSLYALSFFVKFHHNCSSSFLVVAETRFVLLTDGQTQQEMLIGTKMWW